MGTLTLNLSSTGFYSVLPKSHNRMVFAMRANESLFMLLLLNFINRSNWNRHTLGSGLQKVDKLSLTTIVQCISESLSVPLNPWVNHLRIVISP